MGVADEILKRRMGAVQPAHGVETGIASEIVQRHFKPTEQISTITGKPEQEFTGKGGTGASVWTHYKQGHVEDPISKVRIYSADRFPELSEQERMSRYKIQDGEIIFKSDNGKWYSEDPEAFPMKIKRFIGETGANAPAIALGTAGEIVAGPVGAASGAMAGESIRKNIGRYVFGEQTPMVEYLKDVGLEGVLGGAGSIPGRGGIRLLRKAGGLAGGRKALRTVRVAGKELPLIDFKKAAKLQSQYKKEFGVDLFDAQSTGSRRLLDKINLFGDLPETTDLVKVAKEIQDEQAFKAADDFMDSLYNPDPDFIKSTGVKMRDGSIVSDSTRPLSRSADMDKVSNKLDVLDDQGYVTSKGEFLTKREGADVVGLPTDDPKAIIGAQIPGTDQLNVGDKISQAAQKSIDREVGARLGKAKPYYDRAFASDTKVDIQPHIDELNDMISKSAETSPRRKKLLEYKRMLHRTVIIGKGAKKRKQLIPEHRIERLDELKKSIDEFLEPRVGDAPVSKRTKKDIRDIKNRILEDLDDANDDYKRARQIWADDSEAIKRLTNKTRLQGIAGLEGQRVVDASRQLFQKANNSPRIVKQMRSRIMREDPEAWNAGLRTYVEDIFEKMPGSAEGGAANTAKVFNSFWRKTMGDKKQRRLLAAAMGGENSAQFKHFENFADMLKRVGWIVRKESTTATRQVSLQEEKAGTSFAAKQVKAFFQPLVTHRKLSWEKLMQMQTTSGMRKTAEALLDPKASQHLLKIRKMGVGTEAGLRGFSTFASLVLGGEFGRHGIELYKSHKSRDEK